VSISNADGGVEEGSRDWGYRRKNASYTWPHLSPLRQDNSSSSSSNNASTASPQE
jgi:hypothetical protein